MERCNEQSPKGEELPDSTAPAVAGMSAATSEQRRVSTSPPAIVVQPYDDCQAGPSRPPKVPKYWKRAQQRYLNGEVNSLNESLSDAESVPGKGKGKAPQRPAFSSSSSDDDSRESRKSSMENARIERLKAQFYARRAPGVEDSTESQVETQQEGLTASDPASDTPSTSRSALRLMDEKSFASSRSILDRIMESTRAEAATDQTNGSGQAELPQRAASETLVRRSLRSRLTGTLRRRKGATLALQEPDARRASEPAGGHSNESPRPA
ncbi:hypothetical protein KEM52_005942 [Ascosphaera acerosa]|nr:hypothetical protein KEM52_005942 [Ascosphaera acerosa]